MTNDDTLDAAPKQGIIAGFKEFIARGNAVELAVGVVIGGAFKGVVDAIVEKFLNPLVAGVVGKPNFDNVLEFHIRSAAIQPGAIITQLVNFLLIAAAVYLCVVVPLNKLNRVAKAKLAVQAKAEAAQKLEDDKAEVAQEEAEKDKLDQVLQTSGAALAQQNQQLAILAEIRDLMAGQATASQTRNPQKFD